MYHLATPDEVLKLIDFSQPIAFDTETINLYGRPRLAQFYQQHWEEAQLIEWPDMDILPILSALNANNTPILTQYGTYDHSVIQDHIYRNWVPNNPVDTFYLARLKYPRLEANSLDELVRVITNRDPYATYGLDKKALQKSDWSASILTNDQLMYAALDVTEIFKVYEDVKDFETDISYRLDMIAVKKALHFQRNGFPVLEDVVRKLFRDNEEAYKSMGMTINVNSWQQVRPYVNLDASDALALTTASLQGNTRAAEVLKARRLLKQNTFLQKFLTEDGRIYGHFAPSARSGRFTCSEQNLQQLPRKLKGVFGFREDDGRVLLYSDYPQLELRTIAAITQERKLIELFKSGGDPHGYVAEILFGANWTPDDRQVTKTYNFNLLYCGGAAMIQSIFIQQSSMLRDLELIKREVRLWKNAWPAIRNWQEEVVRSHRRGSLKSTPLGRRYIGKLLTDHANIENQGFGAEIAKLAMHYMYDGLTEHGALLCNFIHDSYLIEMERDEAKNRKVAKLVKEAMQEAWFEGCKAVAVQDIPMPAEVTCGFNWGDIEAGKYLFKEA